MGFNLVFAKDAIRSSEEHTLKEFPLAKASAEFRVIEKNFESVNFKSE